MFNQRTKAESLHFCPAFVYALLAFRFFLFTLKIYRKMKLFNLIFNAINPHKKSNWLSRRYHLWLYERQKEDNEKFRLLEKDKSVYFNVSGAGDIRISRDCHNWTGKVVGFSFGVEWGSRGFTGGVLGRDEAKRMAEFILTKCSDVNENMEDERQRLKKNMFNRTE
jgi:hypothetical protein